MDASLNDTFIHCENTCAAQVIEDREKGHVASIGQGGSSEGDTVWKPTRAGINTDTICQLAVCGVCRIAGRAIGPSINTLLTDCIQQTPIRFHTP